MLDDRISYAARRPSHHAILTLRLGVWGGDQEVNCAAAHCCESPNWANVLILFFFVKTPIVSVAAYAQDSPYRRWLCCRYRMVTEDTWSPKWRSSQPRKDDNSRASS